LNATRLLAQRNVLLQTLLLLAVWVYLYTLHFDNDGLWFQGDAPRHAVNGFFWIDYLRDFTADAKNYALSYYARYPAIDPASRPPVFYLLEGAAFSLAGPSPYVAKTLVLIFALMAALYLMAWLRRWLSTQAGWAAGLLLLLPGMTTWSHAIMLNVPALAFGLGALYHARRWLEAAATGRRDLLLTTLLTLLGILTYYPTGVVVFVIASWIAFQRDWKRPSYTTMLAVTGFCVLVLLPFTWIIAHWARVQLGWILPPASHLGTLSTWMFYPSRMPQIVNVHLLCLAGIGLVSAILQRRWRNEVIMLTTWILVLYVVFSVLHAKDVRYALPLMIPLVLLSAIGVVAICEWLTEHLRFRHIDSRKLTTMTLLTILVSQAYLAERHSVPSISGYREVVSFLEQVAPAEPVFYDGYHNGIFTFYVRAGDEHFQRRVVLGSKLLYATAIIPGWRYQEFVNSPEDVIRVLQERGGCRWLAIEMPAQKQQLPAMQHLRDAVGTSAFEFIRSFPISAPTIDRVDVYRFRLPVTNVEEVELPFPTLDAEARYSARPISPRHSR
jgi:hypothetical protein